jgi:hypothetical protein
MTNILDTVEPDGFSIDHSTGTPILMHNNCSVIEGELAYSILNLISRFQWQPIETVPKDGTKVLVGCFKPGAEKYGLVEVDWYSTGGSSRFSFIGFGRFNHIYYPATHWMPLPPVPEEGKAESQKPTPDQAYYMMPCAQGHRRRNQPAISTYELLRMAEGEKHE